MAIFDGVMDEENLKLLVADAQNGIRVRLDGLKCYGAYLRVEIAKVKKIVAAGAEEHTPTVGMAWDAREPLEGKYKPERSVNRLRALSDYLEIWKQVYPIYLKANKYVQVGCWNDALKTLKAAYPIVSESVAPARMIQADINVLTFFLAYEESGKHAVPKRRRRPSVKRSSQRQR